MVKDTVKGMIKEFEEPKQVTEAMKMGLARMFADRDMRDYLTNAIAVANVNALTLIEQGKFTESQAYVARAKSLEQLLKKGREHFTHFQELSAKIKEHEKNTESVSN